VKMNALHFFKAGVINDPVTQCHNPVYPNHLNDCESLRTRMHYHIHKNLLLVCRKPDESTQPIYHWFTTLLTSTLGPLKYLFPSALYPTLCMYVSPTSVSCPIYPILLESITSVTPNKDHKTLRSLLFVTV
jgi:hypothetical protein